MGLFLDILLLAVIVIMTAAHAYKGILSCICGAIAAVLALLAGSYMAGTNGDLFLPKIRHAYQKIADASDGWIEKIKVTPEKLSAVLMFTLTFIVVFVLIKLISLPLVKKKGIANVVNHVVGFTVGLLIGVLCAQLLTTLAFSAADILAAHTEMFDADMFDSCVIAKILNKFNLIEWILTLMKL